MEKKGCKSPEGFQKAHFFESLLDSVLQLGPWWLVLLFLWSK